MFAMGQIRFAFALVITSSALWAQQWAAVNIPLTNWTAPQLWSAPRAQGATAFNGVGTQAVGATAPLQFVAITPCRVVDTRAGQGFTGTFGPPALVANTARIIPIPSSSCGVPSSGAYSLNFTVVPPGPLVFLSAWPDDQPFPNTSVLNAPNGGIVANGAVIPSGADGGIQVRASNPTDLIIDINGYYTPQLSLAPGSASAPTLTFAGDSTSGLYSSGTGTVSVATGGINRLTVASNGNVGIGTATPGSKLDVAGDINLTGNIRKNGELFLHNVGNGTTALGSSSLANNSGAGNTSVGFRALYTNTSGSDNTAVGLQGLFSNTTGNNNTAIGHGALNANTIGSNNTATGSGALENNTTGSVNTATGTGALIASQTYLKFPNPRSSTDGSHL